MSKPGQVNVMVLLGIYVEFIKKNENKINIIFKLKL